MAALPRKFPSPSPEDDDELDDEDIEDASCEELVVTGIPFVPNKVTVSRCEKSHDIVVIYF